MITLFRRIRQQLIDSGSITKYLLYAVGEILLVVIGILIALQVNNWNSERKNVIEEQFYLGKLHQNLVQDTIAIGNTLEVLNSYLNDTKHVLELIESNEEIRFSDGRIQSPLLAVLSMTPVMSTWDNLQSTGKISLIRNPILNEKLYEYYNSEYSGSQSWTAALESYSRNVIGPYMMTFDQFHFGVPDSLRPDFNFFNRTASEYNESLMIKNALMFKYSGYLILRSRMQENRVSAMELIEILKSEIDT